MSAAGKDVVRISYNQLEKLSEKYGNNESKRTESRPVAGRAERDRPKKKRPDLEIYRPGQGRIVQAREDVAPRDAGRPLQSSGDYTSDRGSSSEKEVEQLASNIHQVSLGGGGQSAPPAPPQHDDRPQADQRAGVGASHDKQSKRSKRPDIPIYIPKPRQQHLQQMREDSVSPEDAVAEGGEVPSTGVSGSSHVTSPSRKVDIRPDVSDMVVTVLNSEPSQRGRGGRGRGRRSNERDFARQQSQEAGFYNRSRNSSKERSYQSQRSSSQPGSGDRRPPESEYGKPPSGRPGDNGRQRPLKDSQGGDTRRGRGRGRSKGRTRQPSGGSDVNYMSDASHDSLEWDYQGDVDIDLDDIDVISTEVYTNSKFEHGSTKSPKVAPKKGDHGRIERPHALDVKSDSQPPSGLKASKSPISPSIDVHNLVLLGNLVMDKDNEMEWDEMDDDLAGKTDEEGTPTQSPHKRKRRRPRKSRHKNDSVSESSQDGGDNLPTPTGSKPPPGVQPSPKLQRAHPSPKTQRAHSGHPQQQQQQQHHQQQQHQQQHHQQYQNPRQQQNQPMSPRDDSRSRQPSGGGAAALLSPRSQRHRKPQRQHEQQQQQHQPPQHHPVHQQQQQQRSQTQPKSTQQSQPIVAQNTSNNAIISPNIDIPQSGKIPPRVRRDTAESYDDITGVDMEDDDAWVSEEEIEIALGDTIDLEHMSWGEQVELEDKMREQIRKQRLLQKEQAAKEKAEKEKSRNEKGRPDKIGKTSSKEKLGRGHSGSDKSKSPTPEKQGSGRKSKRRTRKGSTRDNANNSNKAASHADAKDSKVQREGADTEKKNMNLKVTFASNERQVKVCGSDDRPAHDGPPGRKLSDDHTGGGGAGRSDGSADRGRRRRNSRDDMLDGRNNSHGRMRHDSGGRKRHDSGGNRQRHASNEHPPRNAPSPRGGGIIRLPSPAALDPPINPTAPVIRGRPSRGSRGRGGSRHQLYDPNNPNKSTSTNNTLHFYDPHEAALDPFMGHPAARGVSSDVYYDYSRAMSLQAGGDGSEYSTSPQQHFQYGAMAYAPHPHDNGIYQDDTYSRDPYYHSGYEAEAPSGRLLSQNLKKAEVIMQEIPPLESQLSNLLARRIHGNESIHSIMSVRRELQSRCAEVLLLDPDLANKNNIEATLWKSAFYTVIEALRRHATEQNDPKIRDIQINLLTEATGFYEGLLRSLQATFQFSLEVHLDVNQLPPENLTRSVKLGLLSAQRTMICLGDIARYREQAMQTSNYGKARSWYLKAQIIAPKNGRPYNQLAILALYTRRKLEAVYYYMRSLAASNPFITARESLMSLFDDARKRSEALEKKRLAEQQQRRETRRKRRSAEGHRVEVWISPDGHSTERKESDDEEEKYKLRQICSSELNRQFTWSFLNAHGKLFTKIGMEVFPDILTQMLHEYEALLLHSMSPIGGMRLIQLMAINMFGVDNATPKEASGEPSVLLAPALVLLLQMFGILVARCVTLFSEHLLSGSISIMNDDLHAYIPAVKVTADWIIVHSALWNDPAIQKDMINNDHVDVWQSVATLCNVLKRVDITHVKLYQTKKEGCDVVILTEDRMLTQFVPLLSVPNNAVYVHSTVDKEVAQDCQRIECLRTFGEYLCGQEIPTLTYNVLTNLYEAVEGQLHNTSRGSDRSYGHQTSRESEDDVVIESEEEEEEGADGEMLKHLKAKREDLQRQVKEKQQHEERVAQVLSTDMQCHRPFILEVCPTFLVPDTNCFIDFLAGIEQILKLTKYTIIVPLIVINELDGLAKGQRDGQYDDPDHAAIVSQNASQAVAFLEAQFRCRSGNIRAMTAQGTTLETITIRTEETIEDGCNDDLILSCCLHYCKDKARDFMPAERDGTVRLKRDVVLLTDDRNLRLKAHTRNVPVKDISAFLRWAKVG